MRVDVSQLNKSRDELVWIVEQWVVGRNAERNRQILIMSIIDGVCYETIAERMDISVATVKRAVHRYSDTVVRHM